MVAAHADRSGRPWDCSARGRGSAPPLAPVGVHLDDPGATVEHVVVNDLRNEIFYATIVIKIDDRTIEIDSRPSHAIALAVRVNASIFVEESVMDNAAVVPDKALTVDPDQVVEDVTPEETEDASDSDEELSVFKDFLDSLDMDDLENE